MKPLRSIGIAALLSFAVSAGARAAEKDKQPQAARMPAVSEASVIPWFKDRTIHSSRYQVTPAELHHARSEKYAIVTPALGQVQPAADDTTSH